MSQNGMAEVRAGRIAFGDRSGYQCLHQLLCSLSLGFGQQVEHHLDRRAHCRTHLREKLRQYCRGKPQRQQGDQIGLADILEHLPPRNKA